MLKIENFEVLGWEHVIRGMRNPLNSWEKSDSKYGCSEYFCDSCSSSHHCSGKGSVYKIGPNDLDLMKRLRNAGSDHRKFMRMITVYVDITAPLYWWKEFETYHAGVARPDLVVSNSCSTMHKIHAKDFSFNDFSYEKLDWDSVDILERTIGTLNSLRDEFNTEKDATNKKQFWYQMIQLLPSSYNQKRTIMLNYEVLSNIYHSRRNHKLDEWHTLCDWIESLPYSELITGKEREENV